MTVSAASYNDFSARPSFALADVLDLLCDDEQAALRLSSMALANGTTAYNGTQYILLQQAYTNDGETYTSAAVRIDELDKADEDGWVPCYEINWPVLSCYDPAVQDEDCACDWDHADTVLSLGEYNIRSGRIC